MSSLVVTNILKEMRKESSYIHHKNSDITKLEIIATELREMVIEMLVEAKSGHSAGSLGAADIITSLFFNILDIDSKDPKFEKRDRFLLSNGHVCPIYYAALAKRGFFDKSLLKTFRKVDSTLQGHPHFGSIAGIENTSGPLGQGLSQAVGLALALSMDTNSSRVYCLGSDGELQEGQTWEAAMFAANNHLTNLTWVIDRNGIQISGNTENINGIEPLRNKLEAFGWYVIEVDGHNIEELINAFNLAKTITQRPTVLIAHTIPGKGVSFMEGKYQWHGKVPNTDEGKAALKSLRTLEGRLEVTEY